MTSKTLFQIIVMLLCAVAPVKAQTYKLVWADEFDNSVTTPNWNKEVTENPANNELQYYTSSSTNVQVVDGSLVLTARRESKGNKSFTSGRVNSNGKVSFTHGVVMARIKYPKTKGGLWPAFWMMGNDISQKGWPYCGELDIVELGHQSGFGGKEETYFSAAIHWGENWQQHAYYSYATNNPYSVQDDYHIWICQWNEKYMRCFLDDQKEPYFEAEIGEGYGPAPYVHKPMHVLLNLAVGGDFPGITNPANISALPNAGSEAKMLIDWVRIYQEEGKKNVSCNSSANDMDKVPEEAQTFTINYKGNSPESLDLTPAPKHSYSASNVRSLFSDQYSNLGKGSFFDTWGSAGEAIRTYEIAAGDNVEEVKNFGWVGFNYNSDYAATSMAGMDYMHCDIFPSKDVSIGITPISQGPQEYDEIYYSLKGNQWNCVDVNLAEFKAKNSKIDYSKAFQTKWFGGDGRTTLYIDNIFYFSGEPSGISEVSMDVDNRMYDLQGRIVEDVQKGIYVKNGRKVIVK